MFRIGQGFDSHRTCPGRPLVVGGVTIPCEFGLDGHSDADVLLHALADALLGALALGDIGQWFPPNDPRYQGADSAEFLRRILAHEAFRDWQIANVDCTLFAERPAFSPWNRPIREFLARLLDCGVEQVSLKAKTNEGLDSIGAGAAMAASAIVLLMRRR